MTAVLERTATRATGIGFGNVVRSEWTKLRSVRSTWWTAGAAAVAALALAVLVCLRLAQLINAGKESADGLDATLISLTGIYLAQVAVGALGVLAISSEYGTGMIRATLIAVPQRRVVLAAKALVLGGATLVFGEVISVIAFVVGQALLGSAHVGVSWQDPGVLRAVLGGGPYLTAIALLGLGLGALIRHTAGALSAFFGLLFATSALVDLLPTTWRNDVLRYMPANAGSQIITVLRPPNALGPWTGLGVLVLYAAVALVAAAALMTRRDV